MLRASDYAPAAASEPEGEEAEAEEARVVAQAADLEAGLPAAVVAVVALETEPGGGEQGGGTAAGAAALSARERSAAERRAEVDALLARPPLAVPKHALGKKADRKGRGGFAIRANADRWRLAGLVALLLAAAAVAAAAFAFVVVAARRAAERDGGHRAWGSGTRLNHTRCVAGGAAARDLDARFERYLDLHELDAVVNELVRDTGARHHDGGRSWGGHKVRALEFGSFAEGAPVVAVLSGMHAREWISPAALLGALKDLTACGPDGQPDPVLEGVRLLVMPMTNPDGYQYTWLHDRYWRKNRRDNGPGNCVGVDLNRNFASHFGGEDASTRFCAENYRGPSAFSEPETQAVRDAVLAAAPLAAAIDFHSYGQLVLHQPGWSSTATLTPERAAETKALADEIVERISQASGARYVAMRGSDFYPVGGSSDDWMALETYTGLGYAIELRNDERGDFVLPPDQILPTSLDVGAALRAVIEHVKARPA